MISHVSNWKLIVLVCRVYLFTMAWDNFLEFVGYIFLQRNGIAFWFIDFAYRFHRRQDVRFDPQKHHTNDERRENMGDEQKHQEEEVNKDLGQFLHSIDTGSIPLMENLQGPSLSHSSFSDRFFYHCLWVLIHFFFFLAPRCCTLSFLMLIVLHHSQDHNEFKKQ